MLSQPSDDNRQAPLLLLESLLELLVADQLTALLTYDPCDHWRKDLRKVASFVFTPLATDKWLSIHIPGAKAKAILDILETHHRLYK